MESGEIRGFFAVVLVIGAIALAYTRITEVGADDASNAVAATTTTSTSTTTTILTDADLSRILCRSARTASAQAAGDVTAEELVAVMVPFYTEAIELTSGDVRAEYVAAKDFFTDYQEVGEPFDYDSERIFGEEGDWRRWEVLHTSDPPGVDVTRFLVIQTCQVELPTAPKIDEEVFEDLKEEFELAPTAQVEDITVITLPPEPAPEPE